jgi:hypothetical protein
MEKATANDIGQASVQRGAPLFEGAEAIGRYHAECRGPDGTLKWAEDFDNVVCTEGKNEMLTMALKTTTTVVGPYLGLISSASYSAVAAADTMASHAGWLEAGTTNAPQWTTPAAGARGSPTMAAASSGSMAFSSAVSFSISTSGTIKGCFLCFSTGAVTTNLNTSGKLWSAGLFSADKVVSNGDTLSVSYTTSL